MKAIFHSVLASLSLVLMLTHGPLAASPADQFPNRPLKIVVPFPPGGSADATARILAERLTDIWNQPVVIDNRPGAGTTIASAAVAKSSPDGYTLYLAYVLSYATSASLYTNLSYDPLEDLAGVSLIVDAPFVLTVEQKSPVTNLEAFVALAREKGSDMTYASTGNGAGPHLATEIFLRRAGLKPLHVPYKGTAGAVTALLGDYVDFSVLDAASLELIKSGRLKPLAVTSGKRWESLPDVPTIEESGYPDLHVSSPAGIMVSGKVPPEIVKKIHAAIVEAMETPSVKEKYESQGFVPTSSSPEEFEAVLRKEMERIRPLIQDLGLKVG